MSSILRGAMLALAANAPACGTTAETSGGAVCTYQETIDCHTDSGCRATQQCLPDLTGYGPCACESDAGIGGSGTKDASVVDAREADGR